jgi:hypothetical protein
MRPLSLNTRREMKSMPQEEKRRTLIARWKPEQDCSVDLPHTVYWSDGRSATTDDYLTPTVHIGMAQISTALHPSLLQADVPLRMEGSKQEWLVRFCFAPSWLARFRDSGVDRVQG